MKKLLEESKRIIGIRSVCVDGNEEAANYVATLMQSHGLKTQLQQVTHSFENISKRQFNVIGVLGDPLVDRKTRKGLLLCSRLDTDSPGVLENWTATPGGPFAASVKDGRIFGLGASQGKLDLLCKLHAIARLRERKLRMPIYLVGTCGGELGMLGAKYLIKSLSLNPKYVAVGGASDLKIVTSHKSFNAYRITVAYQQVERDARGFNRQAALHVLGRSAHGATPELGVSAIQRMMDVLVRATEAGFEMRYTELGGGETVDKVPDRATAKLYLSSHQLEDFKRFFADVTRSQGWERAFSLELGGLGEAGIRFLPDAIFPCINDVMGFFRLLAGQLQAHVDGAYAPAHSTVNLGKLSQRTGAVELSFDLRLLPSVPESEVDLAIQQGIRQLATHYSNLNVTVVRERMSPALVVPEDSDWVKVCRSARKSAEVEGAEVELSRDAVSSEAALFFQAGYDAVVFGAGRASDNGHSPNEFNLLDQLDQSVRVYEKLIEQVCL